MTGRLTRERMLDALEAQAGLVRFALAGEDVDLDARVAACPDWSVHDLVRHVGSANWWAGANVRDRNPDERSRGLRTTMESAAPAVDGAGALATWYAEISRELLETLTAADLDAPVWTFGGPGQASYWLRRMLHETALHRWDLESAIGGQISATPLPEDVAVDTVDEFCTVMRPLMDALGAGLPVSIRLRAILQAPEGLATGAEPVGATDPGPELEWVVPGGDGVPETKVSGPPETLALMLWGRVDADDPDLDVEGDRAALDASLETGLSV